MERIYHPYTSWEDYREGMFKTTCFMDSEPMIQDCVSTLGCAEWLHECMMFCVVNWVAASEHNLTNTHRNRQAWLGQAACCFAHGAPEYLTKIAWNRLTAEQQLAANAVADEAINWFEERQRRLCQN